jgi:hypothetical protein
VAGFAQFVAGSAQQQIGVPHELMKRIQLTAGTLHVFQGFRDRTHGLHGRVVGTFGA